MQETKDGLGKQDIFFVQSESQFNILLRSSQVTKQAYAADGAREFGDKFRCVGHFVFLGCGYIMIRKLLEPSLPLPG